MSTEFPDKEVAKVGHNQLYIYELEMSETTKKHLIILGYSTLDDLIIGHVGNDNRLNYAERLNLHFGLQRAGVDSDILHLMKTPPEA